MDEGVYLSFVMVACPFSTVKLGRFIDFKLSFFHFAQQLQHSSSEYIYMYAIYSSRVSGYKAFSG